LTKPDFNMTIAIYLPILLSNLIKLLDILHRSVLA